MLIICKWNWVFYIKYFLLYIHTYSQFGSYEIDRETEMYIAKKTEHIKHFKKVETSWFIYNFTFDCYISIKFSKLDITLYDMVHFPYDMVHDAVDGYLIL